MQTVIHKVCELGSSASGHEFLSSEDTLLLHQFRLAFFPPQCVETEPTKLCKQAADEQ